MKHEMKKQYGMQYIVVAVCIVFAYMCSRIFFLSENPILYKMGMGIGIFIVLGYAAILYRKNKCGEEMVISFIIVLGCLMRIGYMLYTPCEVRAHDLGTISLDSNGHASYLLHIILNKQLPSTNEIQFYQQPFFYMLAGTVSKGVNVMLGSDDPYYYIDAAKIVPCIASCYTLILSQSICNLFHVTGKAKVYAIVLIAFCPTFFLIGKDVNSDALITFMMALAFYYTLLWDQNPTWKNTICMAFVFGIGMMTKVSCLVVVVFTACVMLRRFILSVKEKRTKAMISRFFVFVAISFPTGLWYYIRNFIKFRQLPTYVPVSGGVDSILYTGDHSLVERFFSIDWNNLIQTPYADPFTDYNAPVYYIKSSMFGEYSFDIIEIIPRIMLLFACILAVMSIFVFVRGLCQFRENSMEKNMILGLTFLLLLSYAWFYYRYPVGCSMDFRYMAILVLLFGMLLGSFENRKYQICLTVCLTAYSISSCLMYIMI